MQLTTLKKALSLRLGTKSILAVILLLSTISITLTTFFVSRQRSALTDELRKRAFSLASNLAFNSRYAVISRDFRTLKNLLAGVKKESDIEEVFITDMEGIILAHPDTTKMERKIEFTFELDSLAPKKWISTEQSDIWRTIVLIEIERKPANNDEILLFSSPESHDSSSGTESEAAYKEKLGYAILDVSLESMNRALAVGTKRAVLITLIMVVLGALAVICLVRTVAVPIYRLANATKAVAQGYLDQKVPIKRSDEIGILADSFNHMTHQLKVSREKIEAWNRELEGKVAERTKELEEKHNELEKAYQALKTLDKAKDDFLSLVSHELRTPLSSVLLYSEMLLDGIADSEESQTEFLTTIVDNCKRLSRLINDVLDLSKIEAGRMSFKLEKLDFKELVADTLTSIRPKIESKKIHFDFTNIDGKCHLWGDRDKVIQVLTNIISNAVKFTLDEGRITVSLTGYGKMGKVAVEDTGKGIKREDIPKVFDRFSQLESIDNHSEGTGLGMTISKSVIERLGGEIWIESEFGRGTSVFFTLPQAARVYKEIQNQPIEYGSQSK
ncbi:MAG TPA: ATP-binding protein [archaeon]|nr:ATP-binding protein [archaeon]